MIYKKFSPQPVLAPFVECYFIWESDGSLQEPVEIESPPNGFCSIVFNYGDPYRLQNKKYESLDVPMQFVSGQSIYSYKLFLKGRIAIVGIVFKPAALSTLFQMPVYEYVEERVDLYKVFRKEIVDQIKTQLPAADIEQKILLIEDFIMRQFNLQKPEPDYIDHGRLVS